MTILNAQNVSDYVQERCRYSTIVASQRTEGGGSCEVLLWPESKSGLADRKPFATLALLVATGA
jgi:hypothetical protein